MADNMFVVVGLGNPGPGYAGNRHNVGQMVLDELAARMRATFKKHKTPNQVAEGRLTPGGPKPRGFILTTVLGIVGAVLATFLGQAVHLYGPGDSANFLAQIIGAIIILLIWRQVIRAR